MATHEIVVCTPRAKRIFYPVSLLAWVNFMAAFVSYFALGGAVGQRGYAKDGHYFLYKNGAPGYFTEVSQRVWQACNYHEWSVIIGLGLLVLVFVIFLITGEIKLVKIAR